MQDYSGIIPENSEKSSMSDKKKENGKSPGKSILAKVTEKLGKLSPSPKKVNFGNETTPCLIIKNPAAKNLFPEETENDTIDDQLFESAKRQYYKQNNVSEISEVNISLDDEEDDSSGLRSFEFIYYPEGSYQNIEINYTPNREFQKKTPSKAKNFDFVKKKYVSKSCENSPKRYPSKSPIKKLFDNRLSYSPEKSYVMDKFEVERKSSSKSPKNLSFASSSSTSKINNNLWTDFRAPIDFIRNLTSSPPGSPSLELENKPTYVKLEYPFKSAYATQDIIKQGRLCLRKLYIHKFTNVNVALIKNGTIVIKDRATSKFITFQYYLKDCDVKDIGLLFSLSVRDDVSINTLHFLAENEVLRDEWIEAIKKLRDETAEETLMVDETLTLSNIKSAISSIISDEGNFEIVKVIGRGSFGKIFKCKLDKNDSYILKVMRRDVISRYRGKSSLYLDFDAALKFKHKYLQNVDYGYITKDLITLGMECPIGGCLAHYVLGSGIHDEKIGAFYGAQLAMVIIYLHSKNIILRSLTIHDLYLDNEGNLKLVDFGMSLESMGTKRYNRRIRQHPCYLAPELLQEKSYSRSVDWWAYGVCCYVMITGKEPFLKNTFIKEEPLISIEEPLFVNEEHIFKEYDIYLAIENEELDFTSVEISPTAVDFLKHLLDKKSNCRLVNEENEVEILVHEFFAEIMFCAYCEIEIFPPLKPPINENNNSMYNEKVQLKGDIELTPPRGGEIIYYLNQILKSPHNLKVHEINYATSKPSQKSTVPEQ